MYTDGLPISSGIWFLNVEMISDSLAFRATTNHVSLIKKCLPIVVRGKVFSVIRFFSSRCFILEAGTFSQRRQPPPGEGYFILYFSANFICSFLPLPVILRSLFLSTSPDFSKEVSFSFFAQSGLRISKPNSSSIVFIAEGTWDIGL